MIFSARVRKEKRSKQHRENITRITFQTSSNQRLKLAVTWGVLRKGWEGVGGECGEGVGKCVGVWGR